MRVPRHDLLLLLPSSSLALRNARQGRHTLRKLVLHVARVEGHVEIA